MDANLEIEKGCLLVAEPFMQDPHFRRAVLIICEHSDKDGTIGFIINKPIGLGITDLIADFPDFEATVQFGGPVEKESTLHYLHDRGDILEGSIKVAPGIWWGGDFEVLKFLIQNELILPHNIRFYLGYSGWEGGQLREEMAMKSWIKAESDPNYLFRDNRKEDIWEKVLQNKGDQYSVISEMPEFPSLN